MNKQEIEKAIYKLASYDGTEDKELQNAIEIAVPILEQQLDDMWIPISEPPTRDEFIRTYVTLRHKESNHVFADRMRFGYGRFEWRNGKELSDKYEILAWKRDKRPQPYKEAQP